MIALKKFAFILCVLLLNNYLQAQTSNPKFKDVDAYVISLGKLDSMNMGSISHLLTKRFTDNTDKVRAIYTWVALNISIDAKATRSGNYNKQYFSEDILKSRKSTASGFAALFQDLCSVAKIRCLTVDGYLKNNVEQINEKPDELNHTWAVVQLGQSPETWYYVDPMLGSGYLDEKMSTFTPAFSDVYFFPNKRIFNLQHFPDNMAWQLESGSKNSKDFFGLPVIKTAAYEFGLTQLLPNNGYIKTKTSKPVSFSLSLNPSATIDIVALKIGPEKKNKTKTVNHSFTNGSLQFTYKFEDEDSYPVSVLINGKEVARYFIESAE